MSDHDLVMLVVTYSRKISLKDLNGSYLLMTAGSLTADDVIAIDKKNASTWLLLNQFKIGFFAFIINLKTDEIISEITHIGRNANPGSRFLPNFRDFERAVEYSFQLAEDRIANANRS